MAKPTEFIGLQHLLEWISEDLYEKYLIMER